MSKLPAMMLYTGDWLKDPAVSFCAPATRGIWIDLICAMHESDRSGELRGTREQLARIARCSTVELDAALTDLQASKAADVTDRNGVVTLHNRRMKREYLARKDAARRQAEFRSRECHTEVTPPSSSSSSPSGEKKQKKEPRARDQLAWSPETGWIGITDADRTAWSNAYPAVALDGAMARADQWLRANPEKAHKSKWRRFLTNWMARDQERGGDRNTGASRGYRNTNTPDARREAKRAAEYDYAGELPVITFRGGDARTG